MTRRERIALVQALEAFEVGDVRAGVDILLELCDGPARPRPLLACPDCGVGGFTWPGLLDQHRGLAHGSWQAREAA